MKRLRYIGLEESIIGKVVEELLADKDFSLTEHKVIFPSRRMGVFLRDKLSENLKNSIVLPEIYTIDDFVFKCFEIINPEFSKIDETEALIVIYEILTREKPDSFYGLSPEKGFFGNYSFLLKIFKAIEEISVESENYESVNPDEFEIFVELGDYHEGYKNFIKYLPELISIFHRKLKELKKYTRGMAYAEVSRNPEKIYEKFSGKKFIFAGFNALSSSEKGILKYVFENFNSTLIMRGDKNALNDKNSPFHLQRDTIEILGFSGDEIEYSGEKGWKDFSESVRIYSVPDTESEMHLIKKVFKDELLQDSSESEYLKKTGIVLSDPSSLIPLVQNIVSSFEKDKIPPFNITLGYPFGRTPLFQLLDAMMGLRENTENGRFNTNDYLALIRHPYVKLTGKYQEEELLKIAIHRVEDLISEQNIVSTDNDELEKLLENKIKEKNDDVRILEELREAHESFVFKGNGFSELLDFFEKALLKIYERGENSSYLFLNEFLGTALNSIEKLKSLSEEKESVFSEKDFRAIRVFLNSYFRNVRINFTGSPLKGIQIMGLMEFRGLDFERVVITDAVEGILPSVSKYDPILPVDIRKVFGMRTYPERETLIAYDFFTLVNRAKDVRLFVPHKSSDEKVVERSRFIERIIYEREKAGENLEPEKFKVSLSIKKEDLKPVKKSERVKEELKKFSFSPSSIEMYIKCPLRFYYSKVLGLEEREGVSDEPDAGTLGTIIHDSLKRIYSDKSLVYEKDVEKIKAKAFEILEQEFRAKNFDLSNGLLKIKFWIVKERISEFLESDIKRVRYNGIKIKEDWLEKPLTKKIKFAEDLEATIKGRVDRIEKEGNIVRIIDYKTGNNMNGIKISNLKEIKEYSPEGNEYFEFLKSFEKAFPPLQLLIYEKLYSELFGKNLNEIDSAYVFLKKKNPQVESIYGKDGITDEDKAILFNTFEENLGIIIKDILENEYFLPNPKDSGYCSYCPFKTLCGNI